MAARNYGQYCGVSTALELVGERWALLIVRDLLVGPRRYTDLKAGLPRVPTNILSTRLRELQAGGVIRRVPLAHRGVVYELTDYGRQLEDVVLALGRFGFSSMTAPEPGEIITHDSMTMAFRTAFQPDVAAAHPRTAYAVHLGEVALGLSTGPDGLVIAPLPGTSTTPAPAGIDPLARGTDLAFAAGPGIHSLISGSVTPAEAVADGIVHVLEGEPALLERFAATFHLDAHPAVAA